MGSKYTPNSTSNSLKHIFMKHCCECGSCAKDWFASGWQCPGEVPQLAPETNKVRNQRNNQSPSETRQSTPEPVRNQRNNPVCIALPQAVVGCLLASRGESLKNLKEVTNCNIYIEERHDENGAERETRNASISAREGTKEAREAAVSLCARTLQIISEGDVEVAMAVGRAMVEVDAMQEQKREAEEHEKAAVIREREDEIVARVAASLGVFTSAAIREALESESWDADMAVTRLHSVPVVEEPVQPALNMQKLLAAARARKMQEGEDSAEARIQLKKAITKAEDSACEGPSENVKKIRDVFAKFRAKEAKKASR